MPDDADDVLRLPPPPPAPVRPVLPVAAAIVPVAGALVLWQVTGSPFALWFAALGPLMALAAYADGVRGSRRAGRRARRSAARQLARLRGEVHARHAAEREGAWRRTPDVAGYAAEQTEIWRVVPGRAEVLVVGRGVVRSRVRVEGEVQTDEARSVRRAARDLDDAPVCVPIEAGVAVVGPEVWAAAVVRALVLQLCLAQPPGALRLASGLEDTGLPHAGATRGRVVWAGAAGRPVGTEADVVILHVREGEPPPPQCAAVLTRDAGEHADGARLDHDGVSRAVRIEAVSQIQAEAVAALLTGRGAALGDPPHTPTEPAKTPPPPNKGTGSLAATVGVASGIPVVLDLVHDGPHAVVIGVTGSGKSELLTTWIAGMCRMRTPQEVSFLLVDFKGGRTFDALSRLPHVTGVLTDLDEARALRAVESLRAEIRHRERVLGASDARDIAEAGDALARLVIVVDEYAALVSAHPELHDLFADIAARGRALGMHLVLASQRAAGAFRDGVLANAPLRIAFRVTDAVDARTILGVDDAVRLSGAPAARGTALIRRSGDGEISTVRIARCGESARETLRAAASGQAPARRPWLAPLPERVTVAEAAAAAGPALSSTGAERPAGIVLGLVDEPDRQRQPALVLPVGTAGLTVVGGPGSGRSTLLRTLAAQAAHPVWVPSDLEEAWDLVTGLEESAVAATVLVDDADALAARYPAEHAAAWIAALERTAREARSRGCTVALSVSRTSGPLARVIDLLPHRVILALPTRVDHVAAGGESGGFIADAPPGRGRWGRRLVQFAVPGDRKPGDGMPGDATRVDGMRVDQMPGDATRVDGVRVDGMPGDATRVDGMRVDGMPGDKMRADRMPGRFSPGDGDRGRRAARRGSATAPTWRPDPSLPAALVLPPGPRERAVRAALDARGAHVLDVAEAAASRRGPDACNGRGAPRVVVGGPEEWLAQWNLTAAVRAQGEVVVDAACAAEYRVLTGRRSLPPYAAPGMGRAWALRPDEPPRRVTLPTSGPGTDA